MKTIKKPLPAADDGGRVTGTAAQSQAPQVLSGLSFPCTSHIFLKKECPRFMSFVSHQSICVAFL